jgi:uncharacterized membrane protein
MTVHLRRTQAIGFVLVILTSLLAFWVYPHVPARVPVHWSWNGRVNETMAKPWGVIVFPLTMFVFWIVSLALPVVSPRGFRLDDFRTAYDILWLAVLGFLFVVTTSALLAASGVPFALGTVVVVSLGVLLMVLGNFMPKFRKNFFVGIRTPWTLADDEVWYRTHRFAGTLFVVGGAAVIVERLLGLGPDGFVATILTIAVLPVAWSYILYRRIVGHKGETKP